MEARAGAATGAVLVATGILCKVLLEFLFFSPGHEIPGIWLNVGILVVRLGLILVGFHYLLRARAYSLVLGAATTLLCLLGLEVGYRVYLFGMDSLSIEKTNSVHSFGYSGFVEPSPHPGVRYQLKPDVDGYFKGARFRTNRAGLRDREYTKQKPAGTFRVAVIGDSYTMPSGVEIEEAYHTLIEDRLNGEQGDVRYEFVNFAGAGAYLIQYLAVIRYVAMPYEPDMILIGFCSANDHDLPPYDLSALTVKTREEKTYPFFFESFSKVTLLEQAPLLLRAALWDSGLLDPSSFSPEQTRYMENVFAETASLSREERIPIVVAYLTNTKRSRPAIEAVQRMVTENGLLFVDTSASFAGTRLADYAIHYPLDGHPNGAANQRFADTIYDFLIREELLPGHRAGDVSPRTVER